MILQGPPQCRAHSGQRKWTECLPGRLLTGNRPTRQGGLAESGSQAICDFISKFSTKADRAGQ